MQKNIELYFVDGCMRCKYGATPNCKVNTWRGILEALRAVVLETGLNEEMKWGVPVYTRNGKNVVTVNALKDSANLGFFKGVLLSDSHQLLRQQGNLQSDRLIKFTQLEDVLRLKAVLKSYIEEAIQIEDSGQKVEFKKNPEPLPDELLQAFEQDSDFEKAFQRLTPSKQRGYIIYFSQPKQTQTRLGRIEKSKLAIFDGKGLNDKYN